MKLSSRIKSVVEIIDSIFKHSTRPADAVMNYYFRSHRYIGSKDRRFIADTIYALLRKWGVISLLVSKATTTTTNNNNNNNNNNSLQEITDTPLKSDLKLKIAVGLLLVFDDFSVEDICSKVFADSECSIDNSDELINSLVSIEKIINNNGLRETVGYNDYYIKNIDSIHSKWLLQEFVKSFNHNNLTAYNILLSLDSQPTIDLRINELKRITREEIIDELLKDGISAIKTEISPIGIRLMDRFPISQHRLYKTGVLEIQDEGSQILGLLTAVKSGMRVLDLCAGAGGKTLLLAAMMNNRGQIIATDTVKRRLDNMKERLKRAGVNNVQTRHISDKAKGDKWLKRKEFDLILCDVPCLGTGTFRRNPDIKWKITQTDLLEITEKQRSILEFAKTLLRPKGIMIYSTCSLLRAENEDQIEEFLSYNSENFRLKNISEHNESLANKLNLSKDEKYLKLNPEEYNTDGFFAAIIERVG